MLINSAFDGVSVQISVAFPVAFDAVSNICIRSLPIKVFFAAMEKKLQQQQYYKSSYDKTKLIHFYIVS